MENNKLSQLIIHDDLNKELLFTILERFLRIKGDSGKIILLPDFSKLKYKDAILILLFGFKAIKELNLRENEKVGPKELHNICGINLSTVKNVLRNLEGENIIGSEKGKYFVPNFLLNTLKEKFDNLELTSQRKTLTRKKKVSRLDISKIEKILKTTPSESFSELYDFLIQEKGKYLSKCLIVLGIAKEGFGLESLTTGEITYLLKNFIGVPKIYQPNITNALSSRDALRYLFKDQIGGGKYAYKINAKGNELVNQLIEKSKVMSQNE